jgi:predicted RNase H-like HicB family nuclease
MTFTVIVHEAEEGGYWAECLELPGCGSTGDSLDELDQNIREAIESVLEYRAQRGDDLSTLERPAHPGFDDPSLRVWELYVPLPAEVAA